METKPGGRPWPPFHPLLFALFPMLALYANNIEQVRPSELLRPLGGSLLSVVAAWLAASLLARQARKGAILSSAGALAFFSYGHLLNSLPGQTQDLVLPVAVALLLALFVLVLRTRRPLGTATSILNFASVVLLAPSLLTIGIHTVRGKADAGSRRLARAPNPSIRTVRIRSLTDERRKTLPDVYYIVLDAYARQDSLAFYYKFDNEPFLKALEKRGFFIARQSRANYCQTPLCVASALSMTYLDQLVLEQGRDSGDPEPLRLMLDDNVVAAHLRGFGYKFAFVSSGAGQTRIETADVAFSLDAEASSFEEEAIGLTALDSGDRLRVEQYGRHRERLEFALDNIETAAKLPYRKFVFAHVMAPHPPFVFGPNGEPRTPRANFNMGDGNWLLSEITRDEYIRGYSDQLTYINKKTLAAIDAILQHSKGPPVIVLQGDHGSRMNINWESLDKTDVREPFSILNAYLVPKEVRDELKEDASPVNSFRLILSKLFDGDYPPLPARSYYCPAGRPYDLTEVTRSIKPFSHS